MSSFSFRYAGHIDVTQHAKTPVLSAPALGAKHRRKSLKVLS
jgi:hypothetical protein